MAPSSAFLSGRLARWPIFAAAALTLLPGGFAAAHPVVVDGNGSDWQADPHSWQMAPPSRADTGHLARDPAWRGQYVWQDAWHDARTDFAGFDQRIDITELRVTADLQFVYFLIRMRDIDQSSWDGAPQVRIAVDRDRIPGSGRTILGFDESDCLTRTSGRAAWEYLILTRFGSSEGPPDQLFVLDGSFRQQSDPRHLAAISEATDVIELRVPWERIGGRPGQPPYTDLPVAFTVVSTLADHEDRSWWVGGWPNNVLDAVTNYGEPAIDCGFWPCNTWRDVQDEVVDYHFTVHFHLDPDIEPASPLLVQRVMSAPAAGDSEWIALQERRGAPFPLDGIKLGDEESVGGDEGMLRFPDEAVITPGGVVVIAGDAAAFQRKYGMLPHFTWGVAFPGVKQLLPYLGWSTGSISLKDGGEEVLLLDDQDTVLDAVVFGYGSYHGVAARAVAASVDRYLARRPDREDSNDCSGDFQVSPFISAIADVAGVEDEVVAPVSFVVGDEETPAAGLQVAAGSSNPLLLPQGSLVLRGEGANRTLQLVPAADRSGTAVVIVTVTDADGAQAAKRFVLAIAPVNDPPACTAAPTIDGVLLAGQLLTAREGSWNDDRDTTPGKLTYTYHWQRASDLRGQDAASIEGATAKTYSLGFADLHAFVRVQVTATDDGEGTPGRQTTEASPWYAVGNSPPVIDESEAVAVACDEDGSPAPFALTLHAVDADADALFWDIAQAPAHGAASTAGQTGRSMSIVYQPSPDYHGPDSFVVRVRDGNGVRFFGGEDTITVTIDVRPVNDPPQVVAQGDRQTAEGQVVTLAPAATFSDVDGGDAHTALIDWGDGIVEPGTVEPLSRTVGGSHVYADDGSYLVVVTVRDLSGASGSAALVIDVSNAAPMLAVGPDQDVAEGEVLALAATLFNDKGTLDTHLATIVWGDGTPQEAGLVLESPAGPPGDVNGATGIIQGGHVYADDGRYDVRVCVEDDERAAACGELRVTVHNALPEVEAGADQVVVEGETVRLAPANFVDRGTADTHVATIDWGDGTPVVAGTVSENPVGPPGNVAGAGGTVAASHTYADDSAPRLGPDARYTATVCVRDDEGGEACDELQVLVRNVTPTATPALLVGGRPLPGSVVDGRLTFNVVQGRDVAWTAGLSSDPGATDALGLSYRWSFDDEAERNERDFTRIFAVEGRRTATLTVTDPQGATGAQPFEVNVFVPEPPLCQEVGVLQHSVECAETLVRVEAVSPGGSSLWYDFSWGDGSPTQVVGDPVLGHRYRQSGAYTLRVRVEDQDGIRVDCPPLLLEVANTPPRAALPESGATEEGRPLQLVGSAQDCASDVPLLTFLWDFGDGTPPVSGSAVGEHTYAEPGEYTVTLRVEDDEPLAEGVQPEPGAANVARMVVRVANLPPEASLLAPLPPLAGEGECVQYAACAVDPGGPPAEPLTFTWRWADGSPETIDRGPEPLAGCARNGGEAWPDPCGPCPGQCSLVRRAYPDNLPENRPFLVQLTVADPQGGERSLQLGMVVSNVAPRILQPPQDGGVPPFPATASPGELLLYRFLAAEPGSLDLPLLEWELVEPADWPELGMELERQGAAAGTFRWTPGLTLAEQIFTVTVRVRDKDGATGRFSGRVQVDPGDGDLDGLTDGYELLFPDCLAVGRDDRLLDPDGDGLSNLEEFRRDPGGERSSPCASNAPGAPDPLRPRDGDEEPRGRRDEPPDLDLELLAARAQDPDAAAGYATGRDLPSLHYLFVVGKGLEDPDEGSWQVLASNAAGEMRWHRAPDRDECAQLLDGGPGETVSWRVGREVLQAAAEERGVPLENVTDLQWRVRACDGWGIGSWSAVQTFFYNAVAEPPAACLPLEPPDGAENLSDMPTFVATLANPADPDHDEVACAFRVWQSGSAPDQAIHVGVPVRPEDGERASWQPPAPLPEDAWYCWDARAVDDEGLQSPPGEQRCFLVNSADRCSSPPVLLAPVSLPQPRGRERRPGVNVAMAGSTDGVELSWRAPADPDGNALTFAVCLAAQQDWEACPLDPLAGRCLPPMPPDEQGGGGLLLDGLQENTFYYWAVVAVEEQSGCRVASEAGLFFVDVAEDPPTAPIALPVGEPAPLQPTLEAACSEDVDRDWLGYQCELRRGDESGKVVATSEMLEEVVDAPAELCGSAAACRIHWQPGVELAHDQSYCFRCRACDRPAGCADDPVSWGPWSACMALRTEPEPPRPPANSCPGEVVEALSPRGERLLHAQDRWPPLRVRNVAHADPPGSLIYRFEIHDSPLRDQGRAPIATVEVEEQPEGVTEAQIPRATLLRRVGDGELVTFHWRVLVRDRADAAGECHSVSQGWSFDIAGEMAGYCGVSPVAGLPAEAGAAAGLRHGAALLLALALALALLLVASRTWPGGGGDRRGQHLGRSRRSG